MNNKIKLVRKHQTGNHIEIPDRTYISRQPIGNFVIKRPSYFDLPYEQKLQDYYNSRGILSDKDVSDYYSHLQSSYNDYIFGYGITGGGTNFNPNTQSGRQAILSNTNYVLSNALNIAGLTAGIGSMAYMHGITPQRMHLGRVSEYEPFKIGEGAEAMVYNNSPVTVCKISFVNPRLMMEKNNFPNFEPLTKMGVVFHKHEPYTVFSQRKLRIPSVEQTPKYLKKLDKQMGKKGYLAINTGDDMQRIYKSPDGKWYMDDIGPGNIGVNIFGKPKIIDFMPLSEQDYMDLYLMAE